MAKSTGPRRVWAVRMSAAWIDIRSGVTKPEKVVTYLTSDGVKVQNVAHIGGKSLCTLSLGKFHRTMYKLKMNRLPPVWGVLEIPGGTGKLFLDWRWRKREGL